MSHFSADWLALREPLDFKARRTALLDELLRAAAPRTHWEVIDLGAGSGANLRYLAPRLPGHQHWTLVDHDAALLAVAVQQNESARLSRARGAEIKVCRLDLAREFSAHGGALTLPIGALITASALLDLVSADWLDHLAQRCRAAQSAVHFALSYDGRMNFDPIDPLDIRILALVNRHQKGDKGFGPALGPCAVQYCVEAFMRSGYAMRRAQSDWQIDSEQAALQVALIHGWAEAAREIAETTASAGTGPPSAADIDAWRARRLAFVAAARSRLRVGHEDLVGWLI